MKFGASIWPFKWDTPYDDAIERIAGLGFKAIELIAWNREALDEYYTPQTIKHLKSLIADKGLILSEFVSTPKGMASPDKSVRDAAVEHFKRQVEVGVELGTNIINSVSHYPFEIKFPHITVLPHVQKFQVDIPSGLDWDQNWLDYVGVIRRCCQICEDAGVKFALEPHPHRYMANAASMLRLIDHVQSPALGMNLDPSHLFPVGEIPHAVVYQLGKRIFHCHFSDNDGLTNVHWRPGKGKIDWEALLKALKDVGFDGVISIELEDVPGVSRGRAALHGAYTHAVTATEAFDQENVAAMNYLKGICNRVGIEVEE
jgi:sugar phosphate isomerase/epimerase